MSIGVYVLTGFLGSGKTTLLRRLLDHLRQYNRQVVVMMNEMGEEDVDGEMVQGFGFPVKKMLDGCICCSIRGEMTSALKEIVAGLQPEQILIETTGVADPVDVVDTLTHPELVEHLELKGIISVVDASRFLELNSRFHSSSVLVKTLRNQVKFADLILLNKIDLVSDTHQTKVMDKLQELNPWAPLHLTIQSETDLDALLAVKRHKAQAAHDSHSNAGVPVQKNIGRMSPLTKLKQSLGLGSPSLYHSIESFSYPFKGPVDGEAFERFLKKLPRNVYRAKGYVTFHGRDELISFQHTENQVHLIPFPNHGPKMMAVFIGEELDQPSIIAQLEQCYAEPPAIQKRTV